MALQPSLSLSLVKVSVYTSLASMSAIISDVGQYFSFATYIFIVLHKMHVCTIFGKMTRFHFMALQFEVRQVDTILKWNWWWPYGT